MSKNILVLGAGSDIAQCFISRRLEQGDKVFGITMHKDRIPLESSQQFELAEIASISSEAIAQAVDGFSIEGELHATINFMGTLILKPAHLTTDEDWKKTFEVNVDSSFYLLKAVAKKLMKQNESSVTFIASAAASVGITNHEAIAAAKGALKSFARSAASTYGERGMRVNTISPGLTKTKLTQSLRSNELSEKASLAMQSLKHFGEAQDIATAVEFLMENKYITGIDLPVDGGLSGVKPKPKL